MRQLTFQFLVAILLISIHLRAEESFNIPFLDDFEESIGSVGVFTKWTSENLQGWQYWHIIPWNGNPKQCMRFEKNDISQNDWLISKSINCSGVSQIKISFDHLYIGNGKKPKLYYTKNYNGKAAESIWTELNYTLGDKENEWVKSDDIIIENPGEMIYFAFQYNASPEEAILLLLDNFNVKSYTPTVPFVLVGSSNHFEFYTNITSELNYWLEIRNSLEENYKKYCGHWNIPGLNDFMDNTKKTKIYYTDKENIDFGSNEILDIKAGTFNRDKYTIYLSPINTPEKQKYYGNLEGLAVNIFAGYAVKHRIVRDKWEDYLPPYFIEGFGLYEQGYLPKRDSVISYLQKHSVDLNHDDFLDFRNFNNSSEKDILVAHYQYLQLFQGYKEIYWFYGPIVKTENKFFYYFYTAPDDILIRKYDQSENFDIYCSSRDTMYTDSMKVWLERTRRFYIDSFQMDINVRYPLLVMYDEQTGMDLTGYGNFNGGAGAINISPHNFYDGIDGYPWLLAHEFGHVFNSLMYCKFPYGFYHEGMANFSGYKLYGADWMEGKWKVNAVLDYYQQKYNRNPTMAEFVENPENKIDPYFFGLQFIRYLTTFNSLLTIKDFFNRGLDFSVFNKPNEDIEKGYISYLKSLVSSSVNQPLDESEFNIFPNPLTDNSTISFKTNRSENVLLSVYNMSGQKIYTIEDARLSPGNYKFQIDKSKFNSGLYVIYLSTPTIQSKIKLLVVD